MNRWSSLQDIEIDLWIIPNFLETIKRMLPKNLNIDELLTASVKCLNMFWFGKGYEAAHQLSCQQLFSSNLACSLLLFSTRQMVESRLALCRDLLVLLSLIERLGAEVGHTRLYDFFLNEWPSDETWLYHLVLSRSMIKDFWTSTQWLWHVVFTMI